MTPDQLLARARRIASLEEVVRWGEVMVADVIVQDEYTHDVVVTTPWQKVLVFDTT